MLISINEARCVFPSLGKALLVLQTHPPLFIHLANLRMFKDKTSSFKQK